MKVEWLWVLARTIYSRGKDHMGSSKPMTDAKLGCLKFDVKISS